MPRLGLEPRTHPAPVGAVFFTAEAQRTLRRGVESGKREVEAGISIKIRIKIKGG